jgi:hypothetical protein
MNPTVARTPSFPGLKLVWDQRAGATAAGGYRLEWGPFAGWETTPTW